jgi:hypothetical protein
MYQPISFNVIRQALAWHNMPFPHLRQLSYYDCFENFISAEYLAVWTRDQVSLVVGGFPVEDGSFYFECFARHLRECFCSDAIVTQLSVNPMQRTLCGLLYVTVPRETLVMASILEGKD